jgi:hypothetical protein
MKRNTNSEFVGLDQLKARHRLQLDDFRSWAAAGSWWQFHHAHYDWWMFPIDQPSSYKYAWTVYAGDVAVLKQDAAYIDGYLEGVRLLAASWGWNLLEHDYLPNPTPDQRWQRWPIRLHKAAQSVRLFGYEDYFDSLRQYALKLVQQGESFAYRGRDLSRLFSGPE